MKEILFERQQDASAQGSNRRYGIGCSRSRRHLRSYKFAGRRGCRLLPRTVQSPRVRGSQFRGAGWSHRASIVRLRFATSKIHLKSC